MRTVTGLNYFVAISLALILPSAAQVGSRPLTFPKANNCDMPTDREVADCAEDQANAWDKSLNAEYKAALGRVTGDQRLLLVKAQRLWVQYRDANCAVEFAHGGTVSRYLGEQCVLNMTQDRAKELHSLHTDDDN